MTSPCRKGVEKKQIKKSVVDHTYRDYSHVEIADLVEDYKGINDELFPSKLHMILSAQEYAHIIAWKPHGRAWFVLDKALFTSTVLPRYFNHGNFESFNRSVNGWGFKRLVREGPDENAYYHELFLRGRPELTAAMTRLISPGKRLPNKAAEPDFYDISRKYPLRDPPVSLPYPYDTKGVPGRSEWVSSPVFTPPPAAKRQRLPNSNHAGYHYEDHAHTPTHHSYPPPYYQPPLHHWQPTNQLQPPSYAQHPHYSRPHIHPHYFHPYHGHHHPPPQHFFPPDRTSPTSEAPPDVPPPNGPDYWTHPYRHPSVPASPYHDPLRTGHLGSRRHKEYNPEKEMPIIHSTKHSYAANVVGLDAKSEGSYIDERKPAQQGVRKAGKDGPSDDSPPLGAPPNVPNHHRRADPLAPPYNMYVHPQAPTPATQHHHHSHSQPHASFTRHKECSPEKELPIIHSNQDEYTTSTARPIAAAKREGHDIGIGIGTRKPAPQLRDGLNADRHEASRIMDPPAVTSVNMPLPGVAPNAPHRHPGPRDQGGHDHPPTSSSHDRSCSSPPPNTVSRRHREYSPERATPIIHSKQREESDCFVIIGRESSAQKVTFKAQTDEPLGIMDPSTRGLPLESSGGIRIESSGETYTFPPNEQTLNSEPGAGLVHSAYYVARGSDGQGQSTENEFNPLDVDNFYDSSTQTHEKKNERVIYASQPTNHSRDESPPEPNY